MKECSKCKIKVGGSFRHCPLCQNELTGEPSLSYFPAQSSIKKISLAFKIQLFAVTALILLISAADLLLGFNNCIHWSIIISASLTAGEITTWRLMRKKKKHICYYFFHISAGLAAIILILSCFPAISTFCISILLPSLTAAVTLTLFGLSFADKKSDIMPYLIFLIITGILVSSLIIRSQLDFVYIWLGCMISDLLILAWLIIFRWSRFVNELVKRMHI